MNIKASGRSALIIAAGLWLGFAGPMRATDSAAEPAGQAAHTEKSPTEKAGAPVKLSKFSKHRSHKRHVARTHKSSKIASRAAAKADKTATASADGDKQLPLPPAVANANAQMPGTTADAPRTEADALASSAGKTLASNKTLAPNQADAAPATDVVPSDELNDVDRALTETEPAPTPALAMASIDTPAPAATARTTSQSVTSEDATWSQTSLIGKIFIAFGGLLTVASAARMFMA